MVPVLTQPRWSWALSLMIIASQAAAAQSRPHNEAGVPQTSSSVSMSETSCSASPAQAGIAESSRLLSDWRPGDGLKWRLLVLRCRGAFYGADEQWDKALADMDFAVSLDTGHAQSCVARAALHSELGQFDKAAADIEAALPLATDRDCNTCLITDLCRYYSLDGKPDDALPLCEKALAAQPENLQALVQRASIRMGKRQYPGARADFDRALSISPGLACAYGHRANLSLIQGKTGDARTDVEKALSLNKDEPCALDVRGMIAFEAGSYETALTDFQAASAKDPDPGLLLDVALARYCLGAKGEALALWEKVIAARPFFRDGLASSERHGYHFTKREGRLYEKMLREFTGDAVQE